MTESFFLFIPTFLPKSGVDQKMTLKSPPIAIKKFNLSKPFVVWYGFEKFTLFRTYRWRVNVDSKKRHENGPYALML